MPQFFVDCQLAVWLAEENPLATPPLHVRWFWIAFGESRETESPWQLRPVKKTFSTIPSLHFARHSVFGGVTSLVEVPKGSWALLHSWPNNKQEPQRHQALRMPTYSGRSKNLPRTQPPPSQPWWWWVTSGLFESWHRLACLVGVLLGGLPKASSIDRYLMPLGVFCVPGSLPWRVRALVRQHTAGQHRRHHLTCPSRSLRRRPFLRSLSSSEYRGWWTARRPEKPLVRARHLRLFPLLPVWASPFVLVQPVGR